MHTATQHQAVIQTPVAPATSTSQDQAQERMGAILMARDKEDYYYFSSPEENIERPPPAIAFGHVPYTAGIILYIHSFDQWMNQMQQSGNMPSRMPERGDPRFDAMVQFCRFIMPTQMKIRFCEKVEFREEMWVIDGDRVPYVHNSVNKPRPTDFKTKWMAKAAELFKNNRDELDVFSDVLDTIDVKNKSDVHRALLELAWYSSVATDEETKIRRMRLCGWYQDKTFFWVSIPIVTSILNIKQDWLTDELFNWHGLPDRVEQGYLKYENWP